MRRLFLLLGLIAVWAVVSAPTAAVAHAELTSSDPADGGEVQTMPRQVSLTFSEPVRTSSFVQVTSADGTRVDTDDVTVQGDTVTSAIGGDVPAGTYTITFEIESADDHTVEGSLDFDVLTDTTAPAEEPAPAPTAEASPPVGQPQTVAANEGSTTVQDALIIVGFSVVTMTALLLIIRAGMRSASSEDTD